MKYVLTYDVSDDSRRNRIAALLLDHGDRVQKSVYEADLNARELEEVMAKVEKQLGMGDSFRVYSQCSACAKRVGTRGRDVAVHVEEFKIL